jgi:hypothetical protein
MCDGFRILKIMQGHHQFFDLFLFLFSESLVSGQWHIALLAGDSLLGRQLWRACPMRVHWYFTTEI